MNNSKKKLIEARNKCLSAKMGETIICPSCNSKHIKNNYQSVFCKTKGGTKCKDNYWNNVTPTKRNNKTRISPANAFYYKAVILPNEAMKRGFPNVEEMKNHVDDFDGSWDAHNCHVANCEWCGLRPEFCRCD